MVVQAFLEPLFRAIAQPRTNAISIDNSQIALWPAGLLDALCRQGFISAAPEAQTTICPGCMRACIMQVAQLELVGARGPAHLIVCDKAENYGVIEVDRHAVEQWRMTREGIETYLAEDLGLHARSRDGARDRIRYGASPQFGKLISLEFTTTAELLIGDKRIDLADVLHWDGLALHVDQTLAKLLATTPESPTGSSPYQKSKMAQERKRKLTAYRDDMLQYRAIQLKREQRRWTKPRIARELKNDPWFRNMSIERIKRIIRTRIK